MNVLTRLFGSKKAKSETQRVMTEAQLKAGITRDSLMAMRIYFKEHPDMLVEFGMAKLGMKKPDYAEQVFQQALAENPELRMEYVRKQLDAKGMSIDPMTNFMQMYAFMQKFNDMSGAGQKEDKGWLKELLNPDNISAALGLVTALQAAQPQKQLGARVTEVPQPERRRQVQRPTVIRNDDEEEGTEGTEETAQPKSTRDNVAIIRAYAEKVFATISNRDIHPRQAAFISLNNLEALGEEVQKYDPQVEVINQIMATLNQEPVELLSSLKQLAALSGSKDYQEIVAWLATDEGDEYLEAFCDEIKVIMTAVHETNELRGSIGTDE